MASHSPQMDALCDDLLRELADLAPVPRSVDMISTVHGSEVEGPWMTAPYWMDNPRRPVLFAGTVLQAARENQSVFLEISPHPVLVSAMADTLNTDRDLGRHGGLPAPRPGRALRTGQCGGTDLRVRRPRGLDAGRAAARAICRRSPATPGTRRSSGGSRPAAVCTPLHRCARVLADLADLGWHRRLG
ncbi:hypothetical protein KAURM247S_00015 [Kitasatospora aureofaciens]